MLVLAVLLVLSGHVVSAALFTSSGFELTLLHNNDMHGRFEETDAYTNQCKEDDKVKNKCYGGFPRIATIVKKYRTSAENGGKPVLFLNAGDTYTGTPWFSLFKENITTELLNALAPDAMALGNHEFDYGLGHLVPHLKDLKFPIVAANLNYSHVPSMRNLPMLRRSVIRDIRGTKVGIIGYITPETEMISMEKTVLFSDEIEAINNEAKLLYNEENVRIIIVLGHSGIDRDIEIAQNCPLVDIVVGGHSHTYLGDKQDIEDSFGPYPVVVAQANGRKVPVVQAYAFTKYLGVLELKFDADGELRDWSGNLLLLDANVEKDADMLTLMEKYREGVERLGQEVVGQSMEILDGHSCRFKECNLGNLIADGMVYQYAQTLPHTHGWTDTSIGLIQSGGIRASIDNGTNITRLHLDTVLPFGDKLVIQAVPGAVLKDALEWSVHRFIPQARNGEFLQMSGLRVIFNLTQPVGHRVTYVEALCAKCFVPEYEKLDLNATYNVIMNEYLYLGGDGFGMLVPTDSTATVLSVDDIENLVAYISRKTIIHSTEESRIIFDPQITTRDECENSNEVVRSSATSATTSRQTTVIVCSNLFLFFMTLLLL